MGRPDHAYAETQQTEYELQPQEYDPNNEPTPNIPHEYNQQAQQQHQFQPPQQQVQHQFQQQQQQAQQQFQPQQQQAQQFQQQQQQAQQQFQPQQQQAQQFQPQQQQAQQFQPQQQQAQQFQAYPPPQRAAPYPPQNMQYNPNPVYPNQQPAEESYPPKSPGTNQMYANVGPQGVQTQTGYAPNASPQAFPQPANDQTMQPPSPYKPGCQPPTVEGIPVGPGGVNGWRSGLFDFMDDPMNALVTAFFPCLTFGQIAEIVDDGHTTCGTSGMLYGGIAFCIGMPCIMSCTYRTKLRNKFGLPEAPAPDWITHFLCEWCALCQEYRELQHRGWDPSIGWQGNMARNQRQQPVMMTPVNQTMMGLR